MAYFHSYFFRWSPWHGITFFSISVSATKRQVSFETLLPKPHLTLLAYYSIWPCFFSCLIIVWSLSRLVALRCAGTITKLLLCSMASLDGASPSSFCLVASRHPGTIIKLLLCPGPSLVGASPSRLVALRCLIFVIKALLCLFNKPVWAHLLESLTIYD